MPETGDRVLLTGTVESVRDGFAFIRVDHVAPFAVPGEYGIVGVWCTALDPKPPGPGPAHS